MNRVRTGLTGLAFVFLIVLIGAANFWSFGNSAPKAQEETLATLGVAPGGDEAAPPEAEPPAVLDTPVLDTPQQPVVPLDIEESGDLTEI
jgi:hypothetical protein